MDAQAIRALLRRLGQLESFAVRYRQGVITDTDPLSVALGGSDVPYVGVRSLLDVTVGDTVAVLKWGSDALVLGRVGTDPWHEFGSGGGEPAFAGTWANIGGGRETAAFRFAAPRLLALKGEVTGGTAGSTIGTIPPAYRPTKDRRIGSVYYNAGLGISAIVVAANGQVSVFGATPGEVYLNALVPL